MHRGLGAVYPDDVPDLQLRAANMRPPAASIHLDQPTVDLAVTTVAGGVPGSNAGRRRAAG